MIKNLIKRTYYFIKNRGKNVKIGRKVRIGGFGTNFEGNNRIHNNTFFTGDLGFGSYIGENCSINAKIGKYCSIAGNVRVVTGKHPTKVFVSTHPAFFFHQKTGWFYICDREQIL